MRFHSTVFFVVIQASSCLDENLISFIHIYVITSDTFFTFFSPQLNKLKLCGIDHFHPYVIHLLFQI